MISPYFLLLGSRTVCGHGLLKHRLHPVQHLGRRQEAREPKHELGARRQRANKNAVRRVLYDWVVVVVAAAVEVVAVAAQTSGWYIVAGYGGDESR